MGEKKSSVTCQFVQGLPCIEWSSLVQGNGGIWVGTKEQRNQKIMEKGRVPNGHCDGEE